MKTSKIKNIQGAGDYDSKHGKLYKFEYEFEDGTILTANHKTQQSPFKIGDEAAYEVKGTNDYGSWGKVSKPDQNFGGSASDRRHSEAHKEVRDDNRNQSIIRQTCIKAAAEFHAQSSASADDVLKTAQKFVDFVNSNGQVTGQPTGQANDNLPF